MSDRHAGKVVVVTGAARGMGQAVARRLAEEGARLVGIDILPLDETADLLGGAGADVLCAQGDLTSVADLAAVHAQVAERFGGVDALVNVAGILPRLSWDDLDYDTWKKVQTINLDSMFLACKRFVPDMQEKGWGRIVNFSSGIVRLGVPGYVAYRTSKASVLGFTRGLAVDLGERGITANAVSPSFVVTEGTRQDASQQSFITAAQSVKRAATPQDIVGLVSFLMSEEAGFITGQMMHADGGLVMR